MLEALSKYKIVVFGSNSFAGSAFISRALREKASIIGISRSQENNPIFLQRTWEKTGSKYSFIQADINVDFDLIKKILIEFSPDIIVDFAGQGMVAESWEHPEQWYLTNLVAKAKLHEVIRKIKNLHRYIRISTPEVYGSQAHPQKESWIFNPSTPYAVSHSAVDLSLRAYHRQYDFPVIFNRFANFYGPGQQLFRIVPRTIIYAAKNMKLQLHGGGTSIRAFIYGSDIAEAIVRSILFGIPGEVYHFSTKQFLTIHALVTLIADSMGVSVDDLAEVSADRPSKDQAYLMDATKASEELGWRPTVDIGQGIANTIEWVKRSMHIIDGLPLQYIHRA